jgi:hypothetical protein
MPAGGGEARMCEIGGLSPKDYLASLRTRAAKHMAPDTGRNRARRDNCTFIINPPRKVNDITFDLDGDVSVLRCFKWSG